MPFTGGAMTQKSFTLTVAVIFVVVAILHLFRIVFQWDAVIGGWVVPRWVSWIAVIFAAYFGYEGFLFGRNK
jgi:hypothetical protein